jgi:hypothetical protein
MASNLTQTASPPKVRLTFRVGIVGHRPNRLRPEDTRSLEKQLGSVLAAVKQIVEDFRATHPDLFAETPASLRAISPLAEGTDRLFARQALKHGYSLCCPLPFHKAEFENDFKPGHSLEPHKDSVGEFNAILADAQKTTGLVTFELDGSRTDASGAYAAAGKVLLNQSDLLIVVWDGEGGNKRGGTHETLREALASGVSVLWMDAHAPHATQLLKTKADLPNSDVGRCVPRAGGAPDLAPVINAILEPPAETKEPSFGNHSRTPDLRRAYFCETWPKRNPWFVWKMFRDLISSFRFRVPKFRVPKLADESPVGGPEADSKVAGWANSRLSSHYNWADRLADLYADKYRSAFISWFLLGAFAVLLALIPIWLACVHQTTAESLNSLTETICSSLEFFAVGGIVLLVFFGNRRHWHDRWLAYRLLAELVRQLRFVAPLGGARPFPRPASSSVHHGNPVNSWMYWHLRSIDREAGLPEAKVTDEYLRTGLQYVATRLDEQIAFHKATAESCRRIDHRLHKFGFVLFIITVFLIGLHFALHILHVRDPWRHILELGGLLAFFCVWFPAVGATSAGINHQGEFARTARRSYAMVEQLTRIRADVEPLLRPGSKVHLSEAAAVALIAAQIMVDEVLDWRVVFLDRPLNASA